MKRVILFLVLGILLLFVLTAAAPVHTMEPIATVDISAEWLIMIAGAVLSLAFSYIPGLNTAYAKLADEVKQLIMLGVLAAVVAGLYLLMCAGVIAVTNLTCDTGSIWKLIGYFLLAVIANQSANSITPAAKSVTAAKSG